MLKKVFYLIQEVETNLNYFIKVQLLVVISSLLELSMVAVIPFWISSSLTSNSNNPVVSIIEDYLGDYAFIFLIGIILISSLLSLITLYVTQLYAFNVGQKLSAKLFQQYLKSEYLFQKQENNSNLISSLNAESTRISNFFIYPFFLLNSKILIVLLVLLFLLFYDFNTTIFAILFFLMFYGILFRTLKSKLNSNSKKITELNAIKFKYAEETIKAAVEVNLYDLKRFQIYQFVNSGKKLAEKMANNNFLSKFPKNIIELILFSGIIIVLSFNSDNSILEKIAVFGFASFKILPYMQQIYSSYTVMKGNQDAFNIIKDELSKSRVEKKKYSLKNVGKIELRNVTFQHEKDSNPIFSNFSLELRKGNIYGLVGESGSGKSTLIKLIIGLLTPDSGYLLIDNEIVKNKLIMPVSYVSQKNIILNSSVCMNITGKEFVQIEEKNRIISLLKNLKLLEVLSIDDDPLNFIIHQNGENLSGGQLQRLAIVRALYHNSRVIIFDEGTSALDDENQVIVLDMLKNLKSNRIIIFSTHNKSILSYCDKIISLD